MSSLPPQPDLLGFRSFAEDVAHEAGRISLKYFRSGVEVETKADLTPVTRADRETEQFIRRAIADRFPDHLITGEEFGTIGSHGEPLQDAALPREKRRFRWIVDPIDGTKAFVHGVPLFTTLLALLIDEEPVVGLIHNPVLEETVSASVGGGCTRNGVPCRVSGVGEIEKARVHSTDFADLYRHHPVLAEKLLGRVFSARTWADGYGYLLVATGRAEVMLDPVMALWDIAPLGPIISEAGGRFSSIDGTEAWTGTSALATNGLLHDSILRLG